MRTPNQDYWLARREHAFLLRCEGLLLREIGERLGTGTESARQDILRFARVLHYHMRRCKFRWVS